MASDKVQTFAGQCRLKLDSATQLSLQRYLGRYINLIVASALISRLIPASGPTLTVSGAGLSASTLYYLYAFDSAGTLTLEASTTGHVTDSTFGIETKSGDNTRALVGMVFVNASSEFVDSTAARHLLNWFNRALLDLVGTLSTPRSVTSFSFVEVHTEIRVQYLTWADEAVWISATGSVASTGAAATLRHTAIGIDSTTVAAQSTVSGPNPPDSSAGSGFSLSLAQRQSEGEHFATLLGAKDNENLQYQSVDNIGSGAAKCRLWATVHG